MSAAEFDNQPFPSGNELPKSTQRVARWRERRRRGVLFVAGLEVMDRDLRVMKHFGYLGSDDKAEIGKDEVEAALCRLLDGLAWRLGVLDAVSEPPAKSHV